MKKVFLVILGLCLIVSLACLNPSFAIDGGNPGPNLCGNGNVDAQEECDGNEGICTKGPEGKPDGPCQQCDGCKCVPATDPRVLDWCETGVCKPDSGVCPSGYGNGKTSGLGNTQGNSNQGGSTYPAPVREIAAPASAGVNANSNRGPGRR